MLAMADHPDADRWRLDFQLDFQQRLPAPTLVGSIRQTPDDFKVVEILGYELEGDGEHVYFDIEKRSANTAWVAWQLAEFLGLKDSDVGYAGRKDRHAVTRQWFSAYMPGQPLPDVTEFNIEGVTLLGVTRHRQKLRQGQLEGNRFELSVHFDELTAADQADLTARLLKIQDDGFPNYFGSQRFGRSGANLVIAEQLLAKKGRIKGDRAMAISAARAWLFNLYLADEIREGRDINERSGELIGKVRDPQPGEQRLDESMQRWVAGLRRLGAKVQSRPLVVHPQALDWRYDEQALLLSFTLPAGSFATSLLSELIIVKDAAHD